jgi:hypothetical protein
MTTATRRKKQQQMLPNISVHFMQADKRKNT